MEGHPERADASGSLAALRAALIRYELSASSAALDEAFVAAAAGIAVMRGEGRSEPADAEEARRLMSQLPDFEQLVAVAVRAAERSAHAAAGELWRWFGLSSVPPSWDETERSGARVLAAIDPAARYTAMQPPSAKLCSHLVQRYAATRLGSQNVIHAAGVFGKS